MRTALTAGFLAVSLATAVGQPRPDFSGTWKVARTEAPIPENRPGVASARELTIAQDASTIRITRTYGRDTITVALPLDGSRSRCAVEPGREIESRAQWKNDRIIITTDARRVSGGSLDHSDTFTTETLYLSGVNLAVVRSEETRGALDAPSMRGSVPTITMYSRGAK